MAMILRVAALLLSNRMRIIKSDKPLPTSSVQRQGIIQPVRLFCFHWNPRNHKPHPMPALWVHNQCDSVKIEQRV